MREERGKEGGGRGEREMSSLNSQVEQFHVSHYLH